MTIKLNQANSSKQHDKETLWTFKHDFVNGNTWPLPYTRGLKENTLLVTWMGIEPMPTRLKGWGLATMPDIVAVYP